MESNIQKGGDRFMNVNGAGVMPCSPCPTGFFADETPNLPSVMGFSECLEAVSQAYVEGTPIPTKQSESSSEQSIEQLLREAIGLEYVPLSREIVKEFDNLSGFELAEEIAQLTQKDSLCEDKRNDFIELFRIFRKHERGEINDSDKSEAIDAVMQHRRKRQENGENITGTEGGAIEPQPTEVVKPLTSGGTEALTEDGQAGIPIVYVHENEQNTEKTQNILPITQESGKEQVRAFAQVMEQLSEVAVSEGREQVQVSEAVNPAKPAKQSVTVGESKEQVQAVQGEVKEQVQVAVSETKKQVQAVQSEVWEQVQAVQGEVKEQVQAVQSEGKEQVQAVQSVGKEQVQVAVSEGKEQVQVAVSEVKEQVQAVQSEVKEQVQVPVTATPTQSAKQSVTATPTQSAEQPVTVTEQFTKLTEEVRSYAKPITNEANETEKLFKYLETEKPVDFAKSEQASESGKPQQVFTNESNANNSEGVTVQSESATAVKQPIVAQVGQAIAERIEQISKLQSTARTESVVKHEVIKLEVLLNPVHLGKVQVKLTVDTQTMKMAVLITAASDEVRDLLMSRAQSVRVMVEVSGVTVEKYEVVTQQQSVLTVEKMYQDLTEREKGDNARDDAEKEQDESEREEAEMSFADLIQQMV
jgi:hypothetical protein